MSGRAFETILADLRRRAEASHPSPSPSRSDADELARALHELDVYHAELEIQNQDLREAQIELANTRDRYRELFDEAPVPVLSLSTMGVVLEANRAALELLERGRDKLVGRPLVVCLAEGEPERYFRHVSAVVETTVPQVVELGVRSAMGEPKRVVVRSAQVARGSERSLLCHLNDVSAQRTAERAKEKLEKRLREGEKLEAIGRVAANIAHDVNNVLASVVSIGEFMRADTAAGPLLDDLDALLDAAWRGARLMRGLLGLSRGQASTPTVFDLGRLVARVGAMLKHNKEGVDVQWDVGSTPAPVRGDEEQLLQAFVNVVTNAIEATTKGTVELRCRVLPAEGHPVARIVVRDNGSGMNDEALAHAFEPLFTTRAASGGTGLGLALVHRTITFHRGTIDIESVVGSGTTVSIELPLDQASAQTYLPRLEPAADALPITLVLVEDDDRLRKAAKRQFESMGAVVHAFSDGPAAFAAVTAGLRFDAIVADVNMPEWSGPELVERIFAALGPIPVLFVTGASGDVIPDAMLERKHVRLVRKPWTRRELVESIKGAVSALARTSEE